MSQPLYSGPNRSGTCRCGHSWDRHHLSIVMNQKYFEETSEAYVPQECEAFGFNEMGGLDDNGNDHCRGYRDTLDETLVR